MRIGIFGGSFNPPHNMHKNIALSLIKKNYLDKVIYVPTGNKYNKIDLIDVSHRIKMLEVMVKDNDNLEVSNYEEKKELIYTYQTLDYFKNMYKNDEIYFICGSDNLNKITTWKNYKYILGNYKLLVIKRNNDNLDDIIKKLNSNNILIANIHSEDISSTDIRKDLKNKKNNLKINEEVLKYIKRNNLYIK